MERIALVLGLGAGVPEAAGRQHLSAYGGVLEDIARSYDRRR